MLQNTQKLALNVTEVMNRVGLLRSDFMEHDELSRLGEWTSLKSANLRDQISKVDALLKSGKSSGLRPLVELHPGEWHRLRIPHQKLKAQSRPAKTRWEITQEIFEKSGKLLLQPDLFFFSDANFVNITIPPAELQARLIVDGAHVLVGKHQIEAHCYDRDATLNELEQAVGENAWTFYCPDISDPNFQPETSLVHDAKDFSAYMRLWHDQYHAIRHACWPQRYRQLLVPILESAREVLHIDPKVQSDLAVSILSGPEPFLYGSKGFYGALLLAVSEEGLKSHNVSDSCIREFKEWHNRMRRLTKDRRPDLLRNLDVAFLEMKDRLESRRQQKRMFDEFLF